MPTSIPAATEHRFTVMVGDNYHHGDASHQHRSFPTYDAALSEAKSIVDGFLRGSVKPGRTADQLYQQYTMFGDDPHIVGPTQPGERFSAWTYAKQRCDEVCAPPAT